MPHNTATATELTSQYINQVTGDLEQNVKEQDRITAEIAALQEQLAALQHDHTVLVNMRQALGVAGTTPEPATTGSATVPSPRKKATAEPRGKTTAEPRGKAKKAAAEQPTAKAKGRSTKTPAAGKDVATKKAQPTLADLVRRHLTEQSEPRSAAEVATTLGEAHPDRGIKTNVVRTTLENLVARSQAQRSKQGTSVFYTAPHAPEPEAAPASKAEAQPEAAG
ncbi:hypothetical protein OIE49_02165 [Streptomyces sp. NBC_01788]|uniref:hypothetical protein n=1 Tax=Streptomyces sp. NBC_01788 TaxID=2975940 RepID=UPI002DD8A5A2|nr:hypothetical protein [Streptomyces sp. NBC_01788]WSB24791.1 hypothetical protein OIE49_02165 [Streptomyces sp. NBC_01788]